MSQSKLPNFIIFGSTKSGSTSLCNYLVQHPDIFISKKKEPNFFLYDEGSIITNKKGKTTVYTIDWYKYWFRKAQEKAIGEASVSYIANEQAPIRIKSRLPDVKLIALLRDPVSRVYSHYLFNQRNNKHEGEKSLLKVIEADQKQGYPEQYFEKGLYYYYLKKYFDIFDRQNIKLFLFEDFTSDPLKVVKDIFTFLNVDSSFVPVVGAKDAPSGIPKNQTIYNFIYKDNFLRKALRPIIRTLFPNREKRRTLWTNLISRNLSRPPLPSETRKVILEMYKPDIIKLQELIDRDLSKWLS
ncbi:sulfotransferase domain-containing protein [Okeania hirsuta]|uniref:sulfotransferase domain-containing protein n=1 Tax=Okeania hirsuta TaxID=1458930 RepID=UPI000F51C3F8|nr:sulfotransferase domain-containing protein [Okeania hirsuta]RQH23134.1 sulfotransferase [Okeania hirsuta]